MKSRHALTFIFITVLIDMIGFGIIIPVLPSLLVELTGEDFGQAARWGGRLMVVYAIMQFFCAPLIGNLSDRFGRRPVLLTSLMAFGFDYLLMGWAPTLAWLFVGRILAGIAGASHVTAHAFIADVSSPADRAKNFGLVGAAFGLGFTLGPVLGGFLGEYNTRLPFFVAAGLAFLNAVYGFLVLPETLPKAERRPFSIGRASPLGALGQMSHYPLMLGLLSVQFFYQIAHDANPSTWSYYTMLKFDWTPREVGYSLGTVGILIALVQGVLIRSVIPKVGEPNAVYMGFTAMAIGFAGFAFSSEGWMLYAFLVPFSLAGLANPALRGIMANQVPSDAQGELSGAIASMVSMTAIFAPWGMTELFGYFTSEQAPVYFPGAPFLTASALMVVAMLRFGWTRRQGELLTASSPGPGPSDAPDTSSA